MSKVNCYQCNQCQRLFNSNEVKGISITVDLFDPVRSFPYVNPVESEFHVCNTCIEELVLTPAGIGKQWDEKRDNELNELHYALKKRVLGIRK